MIKAQPGKVVYKMQIELPQDAFLEAPPRATLLLETTRPPGLP